MKMPTPRQIDAIDTFQYEERVMKLGIGLTLYFKRPFSDVREGLHAFWNTYHEAVGERFTWARLGGGNRSRKVGPAVHKTIAAWFSGTLDPGPTCWMSIHDGPMDCMGDYGMVLQGEGVARSEEDEESGFVEVVFPISELERLGEAGLAELMVQMAAPVDYYAGVAGYCFQRSPYKYLKVLPNMKALSKRFIGVEITAADCLAYLAERGVPTVNWLTFIGKKHLERLGGEVALGHQLSAGLSIHRVGSGAAIACAGGPRLGDSNDPTDDLSIFRQAYALIRPVQFVNSIYEFDALDFPGDETVAWLTRLG
ncbi:MAG: DUF3396 domain-containing protein [Burkholderiaceae bacterium]|jgi:hypothetical protein|nr:DUF3396 domain-containing protein [Burkholderiaceae bacterium]